jgi:hypothetical protein
VLSLYGSGGKRKNVKKRKIPSERIPSSSREKRPFQNKGHSKVLTLLFPNKEETANIIFLMKIDYLFE